MSPLRLWNVARLVVPLSAVPLALLGAHLMRGTVLETTAAFYLGLPLLALIPLLPARPSKSVTIELMRAVAIALLLSVPVLREGWVCAAMAAPLLLGVAALVGGAIDMLRRRAARRNSEASRLQTAAIVLPFALLALEGTHPALTVDRLDTVTDERVFAATARDIEMRLAGVPSLPEQMPVVARIFPAPVRTDGGGLETGDRRSVSFEYARQIWFNVHRGKVVHEVVSRTRNGTRSCVTFRAVSNTSYLSAYLRWGDSVICWQALDARRTRVTSTVSWERRLDPAWYFGPLQRFYVGKAADVLIDALGPGA